MTTDRRRRVALIALVLVAAAYWPVAHLLNVRHFHAARSAEVARDFDRAAAELEHCLRVWPDDPEVRLLAVRVGWRSRLDRPFPAGWDRPLRAHLKVIEQSPAFLDEAAVEAAVLDVLIGESRGQTARLAARARADHPRAVPILEALARGHLDSHQFTDVVEATESLLRRQPDHALAHFWRGLALELAGQWQGEAIDPYRRAVELEPGHFEFRLRLAGYLALQKGNLPEARERLEQLRGERPDHPDVLRPLAAVLIDLGEFAAARPVAEELVADRPTDGDALAILGRLELALDRPAEAERPLRDATARIPGSYDAHYQLSVCLDRLGKTAEAKAARDRADRIKADRAAIARLLRRVTDRGDDPRARYELGVRYLRAGDEQVGLSWLTSALDLDPEFEPARRALADHRPAAPR